MDSVQKTVVPKTQVAEAKKSSGMKRPKKLTKGSAATKRWMAHLRSMRKSSKKAKTPARGRRVSRKGRKSSPKKGRKTPMRKRSRKTPARKGGRKGRKSSPKRK